MGRFYMVLASLYWFAAGSLMNGESPELSPRVKRRLPTSLVGRAMFTWFNPGPGTGYVFAVCNLIVAARNGKCMRRVWRAIGDWNFTRRAIARPDFASSSLC